MMLEAMARAGEQRGVARGATARRLVGEFAPYRHDVAITFGYVAIGSVTIAVGPWLIGWAIDVAIAGGDRELLAGLMAILASVYIVGVVAQRGQIVSIGSVGQRVLTGLRQALFERLLRLPIGFYDRRPIGDLMSRVTSDVSTLESMASQWLVQVVGSLFALVGIVIAMVWLNWPLALASFVIIPLMVLTTAGFADRARQAFRETRKTTGSVTAGLQEEIVGIREAQAFNRGEQNLARFRERNRANRDASVAATGVTAGFAPAIDVLSMLATAIVIGVGGLMAANDALTVGVLVSFLIYVQSFFRPIQVLATVYTQIQASLAGAERIYAILDEAPEPPDPANATQLADLRGEIAFDDVSFAYTDERPTLQSVSFRVKPGQTVALVGSTGAGKTTIASLIPRFYDVDTGVVKIDGHDVRTVSRASLRRRIALVPQDAFLFAGTIAANIGFGRPGATREEIEAAAKAVQAHSFIAALPSGYDTVIGEGGGALSQGQRQLLALARALLADPRILILDEATSNIDSFTESLVRQALEIVLRGRTNVIIAHRLSTIRHADQILVVEHGQIVERGTHEELLAAGGRYAELINAQFNQSTDSRAQMVGSD